uniref:Uncharacterized protein n=1 Tax=Rhizophora mucronata TaxID=61149 RepID=A0A2P2NZT7_RHIMU
MMYPLYVMLRPCLSPKIRNV